MIYHIRAIESDWPEVIALGLLLRVIYEGFEGVILGDGWIDVGYVYRDGQPVTDGAGNLYRHANLVMAGSLRELAEAKAAEHPELIGALSQIPRYFLTDENGQARAPTNPAVVVFGQ